MSDLLSSRPVNRLSSGPTADPDESPLDTIAYRGDGTVIGAFRCPRDHPRFVDSGPIQNDIFVFPRSSVKIRHAGGPSFVADQTVATVYNRGQIYDRALVSEEGDRCDWFAVPREAAIEAVIANGLEPSATGPFTFAFAPVSHQIYLVQRRLFRQANRGATAKLDEAIYALLDDVVGAGAAGSGARPKRPYDKEAPVIADEIRRLISARFEEDWSLTRLQDHFGVSAFRLCRVFRRVTGSSIHGYLVSVRLRASLERIEPRAVDLSSVAKDLGFSSHSHFTLAFRRSFGVSPSAWRGEIPPADFVEQGRRGYRGVGRTAGTPTRTGPPSKGSNRSRPELVTADGRRVRITISVASAQGQPLLWSESYEREAGDVETIERDLHAAFKSAVRSALDAARRGPEDLSGEAEALLGLSRRGFE